MFFDNNIDKLESRIARLEGIYYNLNADDTVKALAFLIDNGRIQLEIPPSTIQFEIEGSDVEKIIATIDDLKTKFGSSFNLKITGRIKI